MKDIRVAIVGTKFMGRAHSNAFTDVGHFFELPFQPVLQAACGRDEPSLKAFASRFGWRSTDTRWQRLVERDDIDLVDICTSNQTHMPIAVAAAKHGKHILCEKPLAMNAAEAKQMLDAAREAGVIHMTGFNYRRVPAIALAKKFISEGKIGRIYHFNAVYLQDWTMDPDLGFAWRLDAAEAGSGAHGDLGAHIIDLARYLVGEFEAVTGAQDTFIKERPRGDGSGMAQVTVDDATNFLARFTDGAMGVFSTSRFTAGRKNFLKLEIYGSEGALIFNLERLNELEVYSRADSALEQGYRNIMVTDPAHPYMNAWWPAGHIIGWEHTFLHEVRDLLWAIQQNQPAQPDFYDGLRCQQVLDAVVQSASEGKWVAIPAAESQ